MKPWRVRAALAGISAVALALAACVGTQRDNRLRLAIVDWPAYEYFYLAQKKQLDHAFGYQLQVEQFAALNDQRLAYVHGQVEAIATTLPDSIQICREAPTRCPAIVLVLDQSDGADQVIGTAALRTPADLRGQRVGLESSVLADFMLLRAVESAGLRLSDLQLHRDAPKALVAQLEKGELAAIVTYAPHSDALLADPRWRVLFSSRQAPGEVVDVLAVSPELLEHQPRLVTALVNTWWAARRLAAAEPQASIALMARRQGVSPAQFVRSQQLISYPDRAQQLGLLASDGPVRRTLVRLETQLRQAEHLTAGLHLPSLRPDLQR